MQIFRFRAAAQEIAQAKLSPPPSLVTALITCNCNRVHTTYARIDFPVVCISRNLNASLFFLNAYNIFTYFSFSRRTHVLICHSYAYVTGRLVAMDSAARARSYPRPSSSRRRCHAERPEYYSSPPTAEITLYIPFTTAPPTYSLFAPRSHSCKK